jgi:hypothetical protein
MDISTVYEMFEKINEKLNERADNTVEPAQVDMTAIDILTERLENVIDEVRKPSTVKHQHHHTIDIRANWFFLSWVTLVIIILGLFWAIANQRQTISQYKESDLKYRYIKMRGETDEESIYRLEQQFQYGDSIKILRKQVEKYEELVKEQAERLERAKQNSEEAEKLNMQKEKIKNVR